GRYEKVRPARQEMGPWESQGPICRCRDRSAAEGDGYHHLLLVARPDGDVDAQTRAVHRVPRVVLAPVAVRVGVVEGADALLALHRHRHTVVVEGHGVGLVWTERGVPTLAAVGDPEAAVGADDRRGPRVDRQDQTATRVQPSVVVLERV